MSTTGHPGSRGSVLITANPFSGAGPTRQRVERLIAALASRGLNAEAIWSPDERRARLSDPAIADTCRCVVAAGGDGTVGAVVNTTERVPLAILPAGNENLLAKQLGFSHEPDVLAEHIARGETRPIDLARATFADGRSTLFTLMISAGFDAEVVRRVHEWRQHACGLKRVRRTSYLGPIFRAIRRYTWPSIELVVDGRSHHGSLAMAVNAPGYAMGLRFCPEARDDDGALDWLTLERPGFFAAISYFQSIARGAHARRKDVRVGKATRLEIRSREPAPVQVDGDVAGCTPVTVDIVPSALRVIDVTRSTRP